MNASSFEPLTYYKRLYFLRFDEPYFVQVYVVSSTPRPVDRFLSEVRNDHVRGSMGVIALTLSILAMPSFNSFAHNT